MRLRFAMLASGMVQRSWAALAVMATLSWSGAAMAASGRFKVITYNIAGLPDGFMTAHPSLNMPQIGSLLGRYDLALIQEDFAYGTTLRQTVTLPFQSPAFVRAGQWNFGDGLSQFAAQPFTALERESWRSCHGVVDSYFDCLTPKGFTSTRQRLAPGVDVDVYNVHLDAGGSAADEQAREAQIDQLLEAIAGRSAGHPVLLAGDTNIRSAEHAALARLEGATGVVDVCRALHCPDKRRIDRIYFRSSPELTLTPRAWKIDSRFIDRRGLPLSDHLAVAAEFDWSTAPSDPRDGARFGPSGG